MSNNSAYLKDYVRMHPNNRMAWYLLGKEYEQNGQEGKANYCYTQAGDIYEAFEASKTPSELWNEYADEFMESSRKRTQLQVRRRVWLVTFMLLLLSMLTSSWTHAPGAIQQAGEPAKSIVPTIQVIPSAQTSLDAADTTLLSAGPYFTATAMDSKRGIADAIATLIDVSATPNTLLGVLGMTRMQQSLLWSRDMPLEYTMSQDEAKGKGELQARNAASCGCTPPEDEKLKHQATDWIDEQELYGLIYSGIVHFKEEKGRDPKTLSELNQPFPDNWIAGDAQLANHEFDTAMAVIDKAENKGQTSGAIAGVGRSMDFGDAFHAPSPGQPFFHEPYKIKVDKSQHLLAVMSGNVIVRVYQVGLGGDRTPEGTYQITEKVMHPNGHDNGEFGSRGMGLSGGNYAIHGTNEESSISKDESKGCVRMDKGDIEELFDLVPRGTKVTIGQGLLPKLSKLPEAKSRFKLATHQEQSNPQKTYHWLR